MSATPIADAIRRIEDRIGAERFWTKGSFQDGFRRCLVGAAYAESPDDWEALTGFLDEMARDSAHAWGSASFNDDPATTHADVMLFLATCLDVAEAEGL